ncbi:hypothetical protein ABXS69_06825 [Actinomyces timonensis]|uniref:Uncharacterized protein n=1 Tax=Actinomyces timonensis TaxID=1288391 RepID=A0AAU8N030_9ACTO
MSDAPAPTSPRHAGGATASPLGSRRAALAALSTAAVGAAGGLSALLREGGPGGDASSTPAGGPAPGEGGPLALPDSLKRTVAGGNEGDAGDTSPDPSAAGGGANGADGAQAPSPAQGGAGGAAQGGAAQGGANSGEAPASSGAGSAPETARTDALDVYRRAPGAADLEASSELRPRTPAAHLLGMAPRQTRLHRRHRRDRLRYRVDGRHRLDRQAAGPRGH